MAPMLYSWPWQFCTILPSADAAPAPPRVAAQLSGPLAAVAGYPAHRPLGRPAQVASDPGELAVRVAVGAVADILPGQACHEGTELQEPRGGILSIRGAASHPDWIALEWARASNASPESSHVEGSLCKVCVRAWLGRGADTSHGTPCEPRKSAFRWAEEAQADEKLLCMLRSSAAAWCRSCCSLWQASVRMAGRVCPRSGLLLLLPAVPKVLAVQRQNVCAQVGGDDRLSFSHFWPFGEDDQGRGVAVASVALSGDLERLKDISESDDSSIFIQHPGVTRG